MKAKQRRSGKCHNCEQHLTEEQNFCPNCGQSNTDNNVTFWVLIKEFVDNYFGIDSKMAHSFLPFLLRPGKLTNRFQAGQIKHFIHPIRLYFVLSLFYFFVISYLLSGINFSSIDEENRLGNTTNIGNLIKSLIDNKIIEKGGGHNMAAGFTMKKNNIKVLDNFIQNDYLKKNFNRENINKYDSRLTQ